MNLHLLCVYAETLNLKIVFPGVRAEFYGCVARHALVTAMKKYDTAIGAQIDENWLCCP